MPCCRERLKDNWGIVDVNDCANAATHLAKEGKVDGNRLCIDGGSAGGQTALLILSFISVCNNPIAFGTAI